MAPHTSPEIVLYHVAHACQDNSVLASLDWNVGLRGRALKVSVESLNISGYYRTTVITSVLSIRDAHGMAERHGLQQLYIGEGAVAEYASHTLNIEEDRYVQR